jgi:hypothetical protein
MVYAVFYKTSSFTKCRFVVKQYTLKRDWCLILLKLFWVFGKNSNLLIYSGMFIVPLIFHSVFHIENNPHLYLRPLRRRTAGYLQ